MEEIELKKKRVCFVHCADPRWVGTYNEIAQGLDVIHIPAIGSDLGSSEKAMTKLTARYDSSETFFLFCSHWPCGAFDEESAATWKAEEYALCFERFNHDAAFLHLSNKNIVYPSLEKITSSVVREMIERANGLSMTGWIVNPSVRPERMHVRHHFKSPLKEGEVCVSSSFLKESSIDVIKRVCGGIPYPHYGDEVSEETRELVLLYL